MKAARTRGLISFEGNFLLMPTHKDVMITISAQVFHILSVSQLISVQSTPAQTQAAQPPPTTQTQSNAEQIKKKRATFEKQRQEFEASIV